MKRYGQKLITPFELAILLIVAAGLITAAIGFYNKLPIIKSEKPDDPKSGHAF